MHRREPLKLVDLPFFARDEDLQVTMKRLEFQSNQARSLVRYAVSPTCSGKTACICPAFPMSAARSGDDDRDEKKFSHYLYVAFGNNGFRSFYVQNESDISKEEKEIAETQGAAFMVECLRKLLNCEFGAVRIPTEYDIAEKTFESIVRKCRELLDSNINPGRILVHVDEYRKMKEENPHFRRGALSVICYQDDNRAVVVSTYVDVPTEVSSMMSSGVCRYAVPVPLSDVNAALRHAGCAEAPVGLDLDRLQKRSLAALKFRIATYLFNNMPIFHLAYSMGEETVNSSPTKTIRKVLQAYENCVNNSIDLRTYHGYVRGGDKGEVGLMESFIQITRYHPSRSEIDDHAIELFLGENEEFESSERVKSRLVSIAFAPEGEVRLTYGLQDLLKKAAPSSNDGAAAYGKARNLFFEALLAHEVTELLSACTLERAYLWALLAMSAYLGKIRLMSYPKVFSVDLKCQRLGKGEFS
jgi:hypothetical protein